MAAHLRQPPHRVDHPAGDVPGVRAGEPNPPEALDLAQPLEQSREIAIHVRRLVMIHDLSEQLDFPCAGLHRAPCVREDVRGRPHAFVAAGTGPRRTRRTRCSPR